MSKDKNITTKPAVYKYPFLAQIIYKHVFYPLILLFGLQLGYSLYLVTESTMNLIPAAINAVILFIIFKYYSNIAKNVPFKIVLSNNMLICSQFGYSKKEVKFPLDEIDHIEGGIFSGKATSTLYLFSEKNNLMIGILPHLTGYNSLVSLILGKIDKSMFAELVKGINDKAEAMMSKHKKRVDKKANPK
jgi:hypothetical protein